MTYGLNFLLTKTDVPSKVIAFVTIEADFILALQGGGQDDGVRRGADEGGVDHHATLE